MSGIIWSFAPFIAFALVERFASAPIALTAGALIALGLVARDLLWLKRSPRMLETATMILFAALAMIAVVAAPDWGVFTVRLFVDLGLFGIVLLSIVLRRPFTEQYARETVPAAFWNTPEFRRTNVIISASWAAAFLVLAISDIVMIRVAGTPPRFAILVTIAAIAAAAKFTTWYPSRSAH